MTRKAAAPQDPINYKLVYHLRPHEQAVFAAGRAVFEAVKKQTEAEARYKAEIEKALGHDRFTVSSVACIAHGICSHVYAGDHRDDGVCIYCGCPEQDFY